MNENELTEQNEYVAHLMKEREIEGVMSTIDDIEWYMKHEKRYEDEIDAVNKRAKEVTGGMKNRREHFRQHFHGPHQRNVAYHLMETTTKAKSIGTPYGRTGYRASKGSLEIVDMKKAIHWAVENMTCAQLQKCVAKLNKTPLIDTITFKGDVDKETGEPMAIAENVPDGCKFHNAEEAFFPAPPSPSRLSAGELKSLEEGDK